MKCFYIKYQIDIGTASALFRFRSAFIMRPRLKKNVQTVAKVNSLQFDININNKLHRRQHVTRLSNTSKCQRTFR